MPSRRLLLVCALALAVTSCAKPEATVVSEAPGASSSTDLAAPPGSPAAPGKTGRFIARCATEAEGGGVPGKTVFTDGSEGVTDHCLRRYYTGMQPDPGSVYVPNDEAGNRAPSSATTGPSNVSTWTPAQPRTDGFGQAGGDRQLVSDTRSPADGTQQGTGQNGGGLSPTGPAQTSGGGVLTSPVTPPGGTPTVPVTTGNDGTGGLPGLPGTPATTRPPGGGAGGETTTPGDLPGGVGGPVGGGTTSDEGTGRVDGGAPATGSGSSPSLGGPAVPTVTETRVPVPQSAAPLTAVTMTAPSQPGSGPGASVPSGGTVN